MSDWLVLGLFVIGFYLYECCTWTPATVFACYRKPFRGRWVAAAGADLPGNESGGFAFSDPLTLSGNIVHCAHWPIAVSPAGLCVNSAEADQFWAFESIGSLSRDERTIRINGEPAIRAHAETLAIELHDLIDQLRSLSPPQRARAIRSTLDRSFDTDLLRDTWSRFEKSSRALSMTAALPLAWLAVLTPAMLILAGPLAAWPYLLGGLLLAGLTVSIEFARVHRAELPGVSDRWLHAVSMTLFPIAAIRAVDRISKERVAVFNPLAVVAVFCDEADGNPVLRRLGFDLERGGTIQAATPVGSCREWYQAQQHAAFTALLKHLRRDPFVEPGRIDAGLHAYCPRCHSQFQEGITQCSDCVEVALVAFAQPEERQQRSPRKRRRA